MQVEPVSRVLGAGLGLKGEDMEKETTDRHWCSSEYSPESWEVLASKIILDC